MDTTDIFMPAMFLWVRLLYNGHGELHNYVKDGLAVVP